MATEIAENGFEPYFTTKATGSGLGMATSYAIIRRHGGTIELVNRPNDGCTFEVLLPATATGIVLADAVDGATRGVAVQPPRNSSL